MVGLMQHDAPVATVLLPCYNNAATLGAALRALRRQTVAERLHLVVVDNGSQDASLAVARELADEVLVERQQGSAAARNAGLRRVTTEVVLGLDADCQPVHDDWAACHLAALANQPETVLATGGPLLASPGGDWWSDRPGMTPAARFTTDGAPLYVVGGNFAARTEPMLRLGGFPLVAADDAALGRLARSRGHHFAWVPQAQVYHHNARGWDGYLRQMRKIGGYAGEMDGPPENGLTWWLGRQGLRCAAVLVRDTRRRHPRDGFAAAAGLAAQTAGALRVWRRPGLTSAAPADRQPDGQRDQR